MNNIRELYDEIRTLPFPTLGRNVGDFVLYDSLIAGCATQFLQGALLTSNKIPLPDEATALHILNIRRNGPSTKEEQAVLHYFGKLERLRLALLSEVEHK